VPGEILYLDSSALAKLVVPEAETAVLIAEEERWEQRVTSVIGVIELRRVATRCSGDPRQLAAVLARVNVVELDAGVRETAAALEPSTLPTLDAIHLATALVLEDDLGAIACYDEQLAQAAEREGIRVISPS
jgi:uncharacterized protein